MKHLRALAPIAVAALLCAYAAGSGAAPRERQADAHGHREVALAGRAVVGKPTAPIAVSYELDGQPALGQPLEVRITAVAGEGVTALSLELTADTALHIGQIARAAASAGSAEQRWSVTVTPLQPGAAHLNVFVSGELNGTEQSRSVVIPLRTGARSAERANAGKGETGVETVISLPAEETR
jgi:hypothetical protein